MLLLMLSVPAMAQEDAVSGKQEEIKRIMQDVIGGIDFSGFEHWRMDIPGIGEQMTLQETVQALVSGGTIAPQEAVSAALQQLFGVLTRFGALIMSLMTPVLLSSLLSHTIGTADGETDALAQSVCFVMILIPCVTLIVDELAHAQQTITATTLRMEKLLPLLLTLLTAIGGSASSAFLHPMVAAASGSMVFLAREVILRLVMCTCAVTAVNHLSDRTHLTRLAQLLRSAVCWLLGVSFTVFIGAMSLQGVCSASLDGVVIRAAKYAVDNFVPVVGGMFSDTMDTLVGCTLIVKNALGVAGVMLLCGTLAAPLLRTLSAVFALKFAAALLEPVADARVTGAIGDFSRTLVLFLITMLCVGTMYFLLLVQMLLVGNLTVLMR